MLVNLFATYEGKAEYTYLLRISMVHLTENDLKTEIPEEMTRDEQRAWAYQIYIKDYLKCIAGIDENVGRLLQYLDDNDLTDNTKIIYTGDPGFFRGEHSWFDKRLMHEESLRMPYQMRYPNEIKPGTVNDDIVMNIDFAPLFLDYAGLETQAYMQSECFRRNITGENEGRESMYYRYWMNADGSHNVPAHYGIRTERY